MAESILKLRVDSSEYDSKIDRARQGLLHLGDSLNKAGKSFNDADADQVKFAAALGNMPTKTNTARGAVAELTKAYTDLRIQYDKLSDADKKSDFGKGLAASLETMKTRIIDGKKELEGIGRELGGSNLGGIFDTLASKLGVNADVMSMVTSKTALMTGAIGASVTAVMSATKAWADYNAELAKQDQQTMVVTGLKGDEANRMTDMARALAQTYNVDFRQAIEAANTLMSQFGESSGSAMQILRDGMQGMIQGDGPKLLNMIQQFAPAFVDAGISADKLVAIIHNSEGGLFSEQNMNAILMGIKNIRLMTKATSDALAQMGIDGKEMSRKMSDGSMTVFEALQQVAEALEKANTGSREAGQVMQSVFGRQGAMQGMKLARAIAELNTNLEETKTQTGEVGKAFADLETANERLNKAIRDCFEYDGWQEMATGIKSQLITALAIVVEKIGQVKTFFAEAEIAGVRVFDNIRTACLNSIGPLGKVLNLLIDINNAKNGVSGAAAGANAGGALGTVISGGNGDGTTQASPVTPVPTQTRARPKLIEGGIKAAKGFDELAGETFTTYESMASLRKKLAAYQNALDNATNGGQEIAAIAGINSTKWQMSDTGRQAAKLGLDENAFNDLQRQIKEGISSMPLEPVRISIEAGGVDRLIEDGNDIASSWSTASSVIGSVGSALRNIENPTAKIVAIIAEAIANIAAGYGAAIGNEGRQSKNIWAFIASAIAATASMAASIATVHSATGYAEGGIIKGNSYSGDNLRLPVNGGGYIGVNDGELILNKAQQSTLASSLQGNGLSGLNLSATIKGEDLRIVLNNNGRRTGRGEYVTANFR